MAWKVACHAFPAAIASASAERARSSDRMLANSTTGSTGWVRYPSAPLSSPAARLSGSVKLAERWRIGSRANRGSARSRRATSKPLMSGSSTSSTTRSGRLSSIRAMACCPVAASSTLYPACRR